MNGRIVHLNIPISEEDVRSLRLDDVVYLTGTASTLFYDDHYRVIMEKIKAGESLPMQLAGGVVYHTGALYVKKPDGSYDVLAVGSTTSSKFNALTPEFIELTGVRAIIGKGGMDRATLEAMKKYGCVYLAASGGCSSIYAPKVTLAGEYWPELTPAYNQRLRLELNEFGPLLVAMDAHGSSIYEQCAQEIEQQVDAIYKRLNIVD